MDLQTLRQQIDGTDAELTRLFVQRMETCAKIAAYKRENGLPVLDSRREEEKLRALAAAVPPAFSEDIQALYRELFRLSRAYQERLLKEDEEPC